MSAGESESDSDVGELMGEVVEYPETIYVETPEDEFGAVRLFKVTYLKNHFIN